MIVTVFVVFRPTSVTNLFIASLALADLLVCLLCVPLQTYHYLYRLWNLDALLCKFSYYLYFAFFAASVFTLVAMSLERCGDVTCRLLSK